MSAIVRAKITYDDLDLKRRVNAKEVYEVSLDRMEVLLNAGYVDVVETKVVKPKVERKSRVKKDGEK